MWKSKFKCISIVKPKYLILMHCGIEILFKKTLVCGKGLFSLGSIISKLDLEPTRGPFKVPLRPS